MKTKKYKTGRFITGLLSWLLMFGPSLVYIVLALVSTGVTEHKIALVSTVFIALVLTVIALVRKFQFRSRIWVMIIGLYFCLGDILTPIVIIGSCQILDELIVTPLHRFYKLRYTINKEIDSRESV